jgi:hypothetical protein
LGGKLSPAKLFCSLQPFDPALLLLSFTIDFLSSSIKDSFLLGQFLGFGCRIIILFALIPHHSSCFVQVR